MYKVLTRTEADRFNESAAKSAGWIVKGAKMYPETELNDGMVAVKVDGDDPDLVLLIEHEYGYMVAPFGMPKQRENIVENIIQAATDFGLGDFIQKFFFRERKVIQDFILNGGDSLYNLFETAKDSELDLSNEDGVSPRSYAIDVLG